MLRNLVFIDLYSQWILEIHLSVTSKVIAAYKRLGSSSFFFKTACTSGLVKIVAKLEPFDGCFQSLNRFYEIETQLAFPTGNIPLGIRKVKL